MGLQEISAKIFMALEFHLSLAVWKLLKFMRHQTLDQLPKFAILIDGDSAFPCFTCKEA
jgi:hypothetical protein